jgi:predicted DNA-binding transcriptional regulator YafY
MLRAHATGRVNAEAERAQSKVAAILPGPLRQEAERQAEAVEFYLPATQFDLDDPVLATIRQAILDRRVLHLRYHSYREDQTTERLVEPHSLTYADGSWYLSAFCRLRQAARGFRLSRIERIDLLDETFEPRPVAPEPTEKIEARVRFSGATIRWVRERQHWAFVGDEPSDGQTGTVMRYEIGDLGELMPWLLGWGASAEALSPPALRAKLQQEAVRLAQLLADEERPDNRTPVADPRPGSISGVAR